MFSRKDKHSTSEGAPKRGSSSDRKDIPKVQDADNETDEERKAREESLKGLTVNYYCKICGKEYPSKKDVLYHKRDVHKFVPRKCKPDENVTLEFRVIGHNNFSYECSITEKDNILKQLVDDSSSWVILDNAASTHINKSSIAFVDIKMLDGDDEENDDDECDDEEEEGG